MFKNWTPFRDTCIITNTENITIHSFWFRWKYWSNPLFNFKLYTLIVSWINLAFNSRGDKSPISNKPSPAAYFTNHYWKLDAWNCKQQWWFSLVFDDCRLIALLRNSIATWSTTRCICKWRIRTNIQIFTIQNSSTLLFHWLIPLNKFADDIGTHGGSSSEYSHYDFITFSHTENIHISMDTYGKYHIESLILCEFKNLKFNQLRILWHF